MSVAEPKREFAVEVVLRLKDAGYTALWAGGCVRDTLMGRQPQDYDVATSATPDEVRRVFGRRRTLGVGASFGVVIVRGPRSAGSLEVATFRTEGPYLDGRHPEHVAFSTPEEDAKRRDFTINGMFYDPVGDEVLDFVGGRADLERRVVRAIGDPNARMQEDKLRMLRAVRFAAALEFDLDSPTAQTIRDLRNEIHVVSAERIAQELRKMLSDRHRQRAVELMHEIGLLTEVFPELEILVQSDAESGADCWATTLRMLGELRDAGFALATSALLYLRTRETDINALGRRLRLTNQETDHIRWLLAHREDFGRASTLPMSQLKPLLAHELSTDLLELSRVSAVLGHGDLSEIEFCREFLRTTPPDELDPTPLITGDDLIARGLQPGPEFKDLLQAVREAQLNMTIGTREQAFEIVDQLQSSSANDMKVDT